MSNFDVGIHLEKYDIEMIVSTEQDTVRVIPGWVDMSNMRPGETVSVEIYSTGYRDLYAGPDPPSMIFERDGRQYFNLTVTLLEDAPISDEYDLMVSANAKTFIDGAISDVELIIRPVYHISATANVAAKPGEAAPGEETTGMIKVTNTGSIYGEYRLTKVSDPDSVVDEIAFTKEAELTPGFYEDFEFRIRIAQDAAPGKHQVTVDLWATTQYDVGGPMDTFTVEVDVTESTGVGTGIMIVAVIAIIVIIGVAAFLLRRPWDKILR